MDTKDVPVKKVIALVYKASYNCIGPLNTVAEPGPSIIILL